MGSPAVAGLEAWHRTVRNMGPDALDEVLAEDVVFHSPVVHTPQVGKAVTKLYLMAAFNVFPGDAPGDTPAGASGVKAGSPAGEDGQSKRSFQYVREVVGDHDAVLEFTTEVDGISINGVDMIRWNDAGQIVDFKVMIRPLKAIQKIHAQMGQMLEAMKRGA